MKENLQIVLFFEKKYVFDPLSLCNEIKENINGIGQPIILPYNISSDSIDDGIPFAIFNQSSDININLSFNNIALTMFERNGKKLISYIEDIFNSFQKFGFKFSRIGYINNFLIDSDEINNYKKAWFKDNNIINSNEFQLAWFENVNVGNIKVNFWKRYTTNKEISDNLFATYDINTLQNDNINVDKKFVVDFIENVNDLYYKI